MFRLFCALAVAFVTTFHVCGIATASVSAPTAIQTAGADDAQPADAGLSAEKCHICATVSLPALTQTTEASPDAIAVRQAPVRDLVSFQTSLAPPPPRA
ncbi:hypothetical protein [Reyranella sp.]|uniref:hypothetical protein n=1 Tax=Reyranella sp. TaxID=1929291 RepID=UPI003C7D1365